MKHSFFYPNHVKALFSLDVSACPKQRYKNIIKAPV